MPSEIKEVTGKAARARSERLTLLVEEAAEIVQAATKSIRFCLTSGHPTGGPANDSALERECGDLLSALRRLHDAGEVDLDRVCELGNQALSGKSAFMRHQPKRHKESGFFAWCRIA